jgi:hypothetical protein
MEKIDNLYESVCKEGSFERKTPQQIIAIVKKGLIFGGENFTLSKSGIDVKLESNNYQGYVIKYKIDNKTREYASKRLEDIQNRLIELNNNKVESFCKEELKVDSKYIKKLKDNNIDFNKVGNNLLVDESAGKQLDGLNITYRR